MTSELNKILFRETVQGSSSGEAKFVRQRGARSEYAHVRISVRPAERGRGAILEWNAGVNIPAHFSASVLRGIQDALRAGAAGLEVTDINVSVDDGSYHDADSNDESFREAAHEAVLQAIQQAGPTILEAMSLVLITLPAIQVEVAELAVARLRRRSDSRGAKGRWIESARGKFADGVGKRFDRGVAPGNRRQHDDF